MNDFWRKIANMQKKIMVILSQFQTFCRQLQDYESPPPPPPPPPPKNKNKTTWYF